MALGDWIDRAIAPFAPAAAARRMSARMALGHIRAYDAAARDRRTAGWKRPSTSADAETSRGLILLRNGAHDLVRNNKYAAAGVRQVVANMIGDGISAQLTHSDATIQQKAQSAIDRWAESRVSGQNDWYGHQKLAARGMIVGGEILTMWKPDATGPDGRVEGLEGDYLDIAKTEDLSGGRKIVQGVQFSAGNDREAYWLFDRHPGDILLAQSRQAQPIAAEHVDHLFEALRFGQTRGVSWLSAVAMTLRDIGDIEDAVRMKEKVAACLALVITPGEGSTGSPLTGEVTQGTGDQPNVETLRPGLIMRGKAGETVQVVNPNSSVGTVDFIRQQMAAVSANLVPYHLMTGDVSQANYSSLRAALLGHWSMLDDWQQNVMIPMLCRPAIDRRLRRLALETGDKRYLECGVAWALPVRRYVDPVKDLLGEIMEIRAGMKLLSQSLAERGINAEAHLAQLASLNKVIDDLGLALDTDPRRLTDSGVLQQAAGYLAPRQGADASAS